MRPVSLRSAGLLALTATLVAVLPAQEPVAADWWAYRPLQRPAPPAVRDTAWPVHDLDRFVLAGLERRGLGPSAPADRITLLRRVTYDLIGLPPTPEETDAFLADTRPDAWQRVVDRLLASPHYGVKWGRHWLDLVRFAETDSYERDNEKPEAWRYRDWVIDALNADLPYGDFLQRQLAGDERPDPTVGDLVATGYYRLGIWDDEPTDVLQAQYDDLDGVADTTARVMLGMSMGCARCHDHKKDPITAVDYYSFLAFFENLEPYKENPGAGLNPQNYTRQVPVDGALDRHTAATAEWRQRREALAGAVRQAAEARWAIAAPADRVAAIAAMDRGVVARYPLDHSSTSRALDEVGGRDGRVHGQPVPVPGRTGMALQFDGDDAVELPRLVQDSFTVSFWVASSERGRGRPEDTRWFTGSGLVDGEIPGIVRDWGVCWHSDGRVVAGTGAPETFLASGPGYADGAWHHVAFTRDRQTGRIALYVDGELVGEAVGNQQPLDAPPRLMVGALQPGGRHFRGRLDELSFFDRALEHDEVLALCLELRSGLAVPSLLTAASAGGGDRVSAEFAALRALRRPQLATVRVLCAKERGRAPASSYVRTRGNAHQKGAQVTPALPAVLGVAPPVITPPADGRSSGRRTALADWITAPDNPLTWRVIANRLWQYHFGRGLSRSPNDLGRLGEAPTHPELLDWLAWEVPARGGSLKAMHRLLVTSASYRMGSGPRPEASELDPLNDLFWRFDGRRLQAEEVRDSILAVNGTLNLAMGGPGVYPPMPAAVLATASRPDEAWGKSPPEQAARRSVYIHCKRSLLDPLLVAFDFADTDTSCPVRFATVQPTQALTMINSDFMQQQTRQFAARLTRQAPDLGGRIALGLRLVTGRAPSSAALARGLSLCADLQQHFGRDEAAALQRWCLVLLNLDEFLYLD